MRVALYELPRNTLIVLVRGYRLLLSPWVGSQCRFEPTCSAYALESLQLHGAAAGSYLATRRVLRCHPWCDGGLDPVPAVRPRFFAQAAPSSCPNPNSKTSS